MEFLTASDVLRMTMELTLGISIKLFCDNGRIHWRDFVNDFLFWVPGVVAQGSDGLNRQVAAMVPASPLRIPAVQPGFAAHEDDSAAAAK